jgi:outer membrane assembly lipoprotein YfiO
MAGGAAGYVSALSKLSNLMTRRLLLVTLCLLTPFAAAACGGRRADLPAPGSTDADKYLFDRGTDSLARKRWLEAREYFRRLIDSYPQSPYRQDAKLGIGDTYLGEDSIDSNILATNEFKEFLSFFPGHARTDYAQYKVAVSYTHQMLGPDRDPQPALDALAAADTFLTNYPNSALKPEVLKVRREALDEISAHNYKVGLFYYRLKWYPGAIERFKPLLEKDPEFPGRDAVYFYLGESYHFGENNAEAAPYYDRIIKEFEKSEYLERAKRRLAEIAQPEARR